MEERRNVQLAARLGTLSAAEIGACLADRYRFLAYRRSVADPRHQALRATMDRSYDLLSADERRVLGTAGVRGHLSGWRRRLRCAVAEISWPGWR